VLSLDKTYGYLALTFNVIVCIVIGFILHYDMGRFEIMNQYQLDSWIAVSTNLIFLSGVSILLLPLLFNGLQSTLIQESKLRLEVESQQEQLKGTISELNSKNQELEQFAYTASHDLKEPLRMIKSFMQLLERNYGEKLVDGAQRMTNSIDELMEYSRVGRLYKTPEEIDSNEIVHEVLKTLEAEIENSETSISVSSLPTIKAVPITFKMLVQNLIANAIK
jgi:signal transduction histidine kinase